MFLTNHFDLPALTIAALYKNRWQVELFFKFKWIVQLPKLLAEARGPLAQVGPHAPISRL